MQEKNVPLLFGAGVSAGGSGKGGDAGTGEDKRLVGVPWAGRCLLPIQSFGWETWTPIFQKGHSREEGTRTAQPCLAWRPRQVGPLSTQSLLRAEPSHATNGAKRQQMVLWSVPNWEEGGGPSGCPHPCWVWCQVGLESHWRTGWFLLGSVRSS